MKAFFDCALQDLVLLLLPPRRPRRVHVPRPTIPPLREPNHRALRPRKIQEDSFDFAGTHELIVKIGADR